MSQLLKREFSNKPKDFLKEEEFVSLLYHDIFDYPLTSQELIKWRVGEKAPSLDKERTPNIVLRGGYYFLRGREGLILKRTLREKTSKGKFLIAQKAASIIGLIPSVKMVAVTGALCMENCQEEADVDLMIITRKGALWTSRILVYLLLKFLRIPTREPKDKNQKNKLCLNMWLDEADLIWRKRNIFTAHEIAQIVLLVNKDKTYERFIGKNSWIADYWPNSVKIRNPKSEIRKDSFVLRASCFVLKLFEPFARKLQFVYMKKRITSETLTPTRALFHPVDWGKYVSLKLKYKVYASSALAE